MSLGKEHQETLTVSSTLYDLYLNIACVCAQLCPTLCDTMDCSLPGSSVNRNFPGKNTGVGCHFLLQGISLTQGSDLCLLSWQADPLPQCHLGSPFKHYLSKYKKKAAFETSSYWTHIWLDSNLLITHFKNSSVLNTINLITMPKSMN